MPKPKLMFETNVGEKLSSSAHGFDLERIVPKIHKTYRIVVSPPSLIELMNGVIGGQVWCRGQVKSS
jgi:hypothetical protein